MRIFACIKLSNQKPPTSIKDFRLEVCTTLHTTNPITNRRKTPTLDAIITLIEVADGPRRTDFITLDGSKQQKITQEVKSLVPEIDKCSIRVDVSCD